MHKQFARHRPLFRLTFVAVVLGMGFLSGCALRNPFASEATPKAVAASGVVQVTKQEKLFGILPVFRPDVQQGNFISKEMVAQLRVGMTPDQVRFVLGSPLLMDPFHANRWDYPFRIKKGNGEITASHVAVYFENGRMARFEGGDLPDEKDYLQRIAAPTTPSNKK